MSILRRWRWHKVVFWFVLALTAVDLISAAIGRYNDTRPDIWR